MDDSIVRTALDVGANDGGYAGTLVNNGFRVIAIEPVPQMYSHLQQRHRYNDVLCLNIGLSDKRERLEGVTVLEAWAIGKPGEGGMSPTPNPEIVGTFDVELRTMDEVVGKTPIGLIKLDTDGYEFKVLRGGRNTILNWKPPILCEFGCYLEKLGESPREFVNYIFALGYNVVSMDGQNVFTSWKEIEPQWPKDTTFDVMLMPKL